ncbi:MAG: hypothetical protein R3A12_04925 [Ignavibacteria bacterium]
MAQGNPYGVAVLAEGIITRIDSEELKSHPYVNLEKDLYGQYQIIS